VVVLLGWDAEHYPRSARRHGDDLLGDEPRIGDPSAALRDRQVLLDAIHSAGRRLLVIAQGRSVATNEPVPCAAPIAELLEALDTTATTVSGDPAGQAVTVVHPLQPFDTRYFDPREPSLVSADPLAFRAARASGATEHYGPRTRFRFDPLPEPDLSQGVGLDELTGYFRNPARTLLRVRAGLSLGDERRTEDSIPIQPDALARWQIGNRVLAGLRAGHEEAAVERAEWLRGEVPPFRLGTDLLSGILAEAQRSVGAIPRERSTPDLHDLDLAISVPGRGTVPLVGRVTTQDHEIVTVEFSTLQPRQRLVAWLRLLALAAAEPGPWRARVIGKGRTAVYSAPPPIQARRLLGNYLALYSLGLSRPLPALPRIGSEWAAMRASRQDPLDPRKGLPRLRERWRYETENDRAWRELFRFPEVLGLGLDDLGLPSTGLPGADAAERTLVGALASSIWSPLQACEVTP
jgi:exodeoxyribonuclease V gamma subunit